MAPGQPKYGFQIYQPHSAQLTNHPVQIVTNFYGQPTVMYPQNHILPHQGIIIQQTPLYNQGYTSNQPQILSVAGNQNMPQNHKNSAVFSMHSSDSFSLKYNNNKHSCSDGQYGEKTQDAVQNQIFDNKNLFFNYGNMSASKDNEGLNQNFGENNLIQHPQPHQVVQNDQIDELSTNSNQQDRPFKKIEDLDSNNIEAIKEKNKRDSRGIVKLRRQQQNMIQKLQVVKSAPVLAKIDGCFYYKVKEINKTTRRLNSVLICAECQKPFTKKCNLIDHLRVHSGMKPFQCNICAKYFKQKAQLSKHCKKHGNKRAGQQLRKNSDQSQDPSTLISNQEETQIASNNDQDIQINDQSLQDVSLPFDSFSKVLLPCFEQLEETHFVVDKIRKDSDNMEKQESYQIAKSFCPFQRDLNLQNQASSTDKLSQIKMANTDEHSEQL
ncbi:zinc finger and btb domain-containing protein 26 [Stylonychia lemnae]|uniref:Zinc finger and btb domain-containing protein 26 n=1 Tax=Stylonychia lemnae TaxID=5949 RepID=A0A078AUX4_STYLE|nr:zinc finger and btb domain-containing protein 26 [Stylonychia lemnae]|eukprot:CDW85047.1 zinc finger and btb domain-containing protein 26 [Stylonychia lemnae]